MLSNADGLRVLHVEDDVVFASIVSDLLVDDQRMLPIIGIDRVGTLAEALMALIDGPRYDVALVDLRLPDGNGLDVLSNIVIHSPATASVVLTADADVDSGITALRHGASDFLPKAELSQESLLRVVQLATERKRFEQRLRTESHTDELTGLANRRGLLRCHQILAANARRDGRVLGVVMFDLNGLKGVNDTAGHLRGDAIIRAFANRLGQFTRAGDCAARLGGDEFVLVGLLPDDPTTQQAFEARVRSHFGRQPIAQGGTVLDAAVGVAVGAAEDDIDKLLGLADEAMYVDKREQRRVRSSA